MKKQFAYLSFDSNSDNQQRDTYGLENQKDGIANKLGKYRVVKSQSHHHNFSFCSYFTCITYQNTRVFVNIQKCAMNPCLYSYSCTSVSLPSSISKDHASCIICADTRKLLFRRYEGYNLELRAYADLQLEGVVLGGGGGLDI